MPEGPSERFDYNGIDLNRPVDSIKPGRLPFAQNMRSYTAGVIEPRFGLTDEGIVVAGQTPLHSIRRLNDPANSTYAYILGAGTHLAYGPLGGAYTDADSGYSGNPLALVPYRPDESPVAFMYVADSSRMRKLSAAGALHPIGLAPPTSALSAVLSATPQYKVVSEASATGAWAQAGTAGAVAAITRVNTTIAQIVYDSGTTGWCTISPTSAANITPGTRLVINTGGGSAETLTVEEVHPGAAATTIGRIIYDSGTSGAASLVLATQVDQVQLNGMIRNTTVGPENATIQSVTIGPDGTTSLRITTTNTWAATNTVQVLASFRMYTVSNHAAAETLTLSALESAVTTGTGTLTLAGALDLSFIAAGVPTRPDDYMHIALRVDRPDLISEIKALLDVDIATNDFTRNFYSRTFRASDLTPSVRNLQPLVSTRSTIVTRNVIDSPNQANFTQGTSAAPGSETLSLQNTFISQANNPGAVSILNESVIGQPFGSTTDRTGAGRLLVDQITTPADSNIVISQQLETGDVQWVDLKFRISDLIRVGTDDSRTLANVASIRVTVICTGNVAVDFSNWWIGGGYGPDMGIFGLPYLYRYRARVLATNVASNWSPSTRGGLNARRQSITVSPTQYAAPSGSNITAATGIVLDIERFGGSIAQWQYVGTTANGASPSFVDTLPDDTVVGNPSIQNDSFQPWPIIQAPASGTSAANGVAGTTLNDSGTSFNTSWAPGTIIKVNGVPYTIYRVISTSRLQTVENMTSQTSVPWQIDQPTLLGQPLAALWGDEEFGAMFACGDNVNPGRLYWSNSRNPDATVETNYEDVTAPSEPLQNGVIWNGRSYVWSTERLFQILPTGVPEKPYRVEEIPGGRGLFSRWGVTRNPFAPMMATLGKDGIYSSGGGAAKSLSDDDLYPLFPNEGNLGTLTNSISPPNIVNAQVANLRMEWYDDYLYFDYNGVSGLRRTLALNTATGGWWLDVYTPTIQCHYGDEGPGVHNLLCGGTDGHLYLYSGNSDAGSDIQCVWQVPSRDQGNSRINKYYNDCVLDCNPVGVTVTVTPYINNAATALASVTTALAARGLVTIPASSTAQTALNINLRGTFTKNAAAQPQFFIWEARYVPETAPIAARRWQHSPTHFSMPNFKSGGAARIVHVSNGTLTLGVGLDGGAISTLTTIASSAGAYAETWVRLPVFKGKILQFAIYADADFRLATEDSWIELKEWGSDGPYQNIPVFSG